MTTAELFLPVLGDCPSVCSVNQTSLTFHHYAQATESVAKKKKVSNPMGHVGNVGHVGNPILQCIFERTACSFQRTNTVLSFSLLKSYLHNLPN